MAVVALSKGKDKLAEDAAAAKDKEDFKKEMRRRIANARNDRFKRAALVNEVFRLSSPWRRRIGSTMNADEGEPVLTEDDVSDVLDSTLQDTVEDFAADMMARFTPVQEVWAKFEPAKLLSSTILAKIAPQIAAVQDYVYSEIERSNFSEAALEFYNELASGTAGMAILSEGPSNPLICDPLTLAELLIDKGPHGFVDGRWYERRMERRTFEAIYNRFNIFLPKKLANIQATSKITVTDGVVRLWKRLDTEVYRRMIFVDGEIVYDFQPQGQGAQHVLACRWMTSGTCAYGVGPAFKATPDQRVLNEAKAMVLAAAAGIINPPAFYDDDGVINVDQGVEPGDWLARAPGSKVDQLKQEGRIDLAYFVEKDLQANIRRALYQDGAYQRGDTPPTLGQWSDENAKKERRLEIPRGKVINEFVLPVLRRVVWLRSQEGQVPEVKLGSDVVSVVPQSTFARSRAYERVAASERLLTVVRANMPEAMSAIDSRATIANIQNDLGEENVVVLSPDQYKQAVAMASQAAGVSAPGAEGAQQ